MQFSLFFHIKLANIILMKAFTTLYTANFKLKPFFSYSLVSRFSTFKDTNTNTPTQSKNNGQNIKMKGQKLQSKEINKGRQQKKNSINPSKEQGFAYGHYFPSHWTQKFIKKTIDPKDRDLERIQIIKNKLGEPTGKVLLKFKNETVLQKYIKQYSEDYIVTDSQTQKIVILPFELKTNMKKQEQKEGKNNRFPVRISNLDFDITHLELKKLADDYGQVSHIELSQRKNGINKGFATVYFQQRKSAQEFVSFIDDFLYRDRRLKAQLINTDHQIQRQRSIERQKKYLEIPTYTFKANQQLMRKFNRKSIKEGIKIEENEQKIN